MKNTLFLLLALLPCIAWTQIPDGYYDNAMNKSGYELKTALWQCIFRHEQLSYGDLWTAFGETDTDKDGYIIDMYNDCQFEFQRGSMRERQFWKRAEPMRLLQPGTLHAQELVR